MRDAVVRPFGRVRAGLRLERGRLSILVSPVRLRLALLLVLASCGTSGQPDDAPAESDSDRAAFTVICSRTFVFDWEKQLKPIAPHFERELGESVQRKRPELRYLPRDQFCRAVFPNLPAEAAPLELKSLRSLLEKPEFRERLDRLNLRYIVYLGGQTEIDENHYWIGIYLIIGGVSTWEKKSELNAVIFDLRRPNGTRSLSGTAAGTAWVAGVLPIVVGAPAHTEDRACEQISSALLQALATMERGELKP
jgi:hypothetical protein